MLIGDGLIRPSSRLVFLRISFNLFALVVLILKICGFHFNVDCECYTYALECLSADVEV